MRETTFLQPIVPFLSHFIYKFFRYMPIFNLSPKSIWMVGEIEISSSSDLDIQIGYPVWLLSLFSFTVLISMIKIKSKNLTWSLNFPVYSNWMKIFNWNFDLNKSHKHTSKKYLPCDFSSGCSSLYS